MEHALTEVQGSSQHGLQRELRPSRRHRCLLPLPARDERGEGWGEGLSFVAHPAASLVVAPTCAKLSYKFPARSAVPVSIFRGSRRVHLVWPGDIAGSWVL